ncbi:MAG TPA: hypothetical protein VMY77_11135 [Chitinophagaceae bacterium]|nr:hypothetical protein [Chitinophagaceae bacterium]
MNNEILFVERQKFTQWWLLLIVFGVNILSIFSVCKQIIDEEKFGEKPGDIALLILTGMALLFTVLFVNCRLDTTIKKDGIYVRFFPFHLKFRYYDWDSIIKSYVRQYSPLIEYGGWGLRFGLFGKGTAFNVSGNTGLQLEFRNHKRLLIGTNKPDDLTETLNRIGQLKQ